MVTRLDEMIPRALKSSSRAKSKKDRHQELLYEIENRHMFLYRAVEDAGRQLRAREQEAEKDGTESKIGGELDRTLRRSRGEVVEGELALFHR